MARLRQIWPNARIIFRTDSGFVIPEIYDWCEANGVEYLIGLITNSRLLDLAEPHLWAAQSEYEQTQRQVRNLQEDRKVWLPFGKLTALSSTLRLRPEGSYAEGHFASACPVVDLWPLILRRLHALA